LSRPVKTVSTIEFESNFYPVSHWKLLQRFAVGDERDPRGLFCLTDDKWDAWPYAVNGIPSNALRFRFDFGRFQTFLKLYAKWHCYQLIIGRPGNLYITSARLPQQLFHADKYISEQGFRSIDDIASSVVFEFLWKAQLIDRFEGIAHFRTWLFRGRQRHALSGSR
jgi:hypothetical protein